MTMNANPPQKTVLDSFNVKIGYFVLMKMQAIIDIIDMIRENEVVPTASFSKIVYNFYEGKFNIFGWC